MPERGGPGMHVDGRAQGRTGRRTRRDGQAIRLKMTQKITILRRSPPAPPRENCPGGRARTQYKYRTSELGTLDRPRTPSHAQRGGAGN